MLMILKQIGPDTLLEFHAKELRLGLTLLTTGIDVQTNDWQGTVRYGWRSDGLLKPVSKVLSITLSEWDHCKHCTYNLHRIGDSACLSNFFYWDSLLAAQKSV